VVVLLLGGAAAGAARLDAFERAEGLVRDGAHARLRVELLTLPRASALGASAEARVIGGSDRSRSAAGRLAGARLLLRTPRWAPFPNHPRVGAEILTEGTLRALASSPGRDRDFDFAAHLRVRGIAGELLVDRLRATDARRGGVAGLVDRMRERAERGVVAGLPSAEAALARGMVLGQDEAIGQATRDDFRASGLAHLLAVSGQNVMLLVALALPLLALAGLGPRGRGAALLCLVALYVPLAGAGPSLQRAGVMGAAGIAALVVSRPASRWYALLLAGAVTLALNPRIWQDPGWQLSFAAVTGILTIGRPLGGFLARALEALDIPAPARAVGRGVADAAALTIAATLATAPLLAYHFDSVPLAGLPANLLALPAVAPAMWLGMVRGALGVLSEVAPPAGQLAEMLASPARLSVAWIATLAERFADAPAGQLELRLDAPWELAGAYAAIAAATLVLRSRARRGADRARELAAAWRRRPRALQAALGVVTLALVLLVAVEALSPPGAPRALTVRFLDVGQGDATLIQDALGTAILFDGGPPEGGVTRLLRRAGVRRLAAVVATHASRDHHGGLVDVLDSYPVGLLLDGGDGTSDPGFRSVLAAARRRRVRRVAALAPLTLRAGRLTIRVLSPPPRPDGPPPEDPNPRAVIAVVSAGAFDLLLSADAESPSLLPLALPDVDAMKVPHHGSADPGLPELLERVRPELAAIPVGENTYGHPAPSTLRALARARVPTYRTDLDGTIRVTPAHGLLDVETER